MNKILLFRFMASCFEKVQINYYSAESGKFPRIMTNGLSQRQLKEEGKILQKTHKAPSSTHRKSQHLSHLLWLHPFLYSPLNHQSVILHHCLELLYSDYQR